MVTSLCLGSTGRCVVAPAQHQVSSLRKMKAGPMWLAPPSTTGLHPLRSPATSR